MKTYTFKVIIEPDEDRWLAYSPALADRGGATWGYTKEEAQANIREVLKMTLQSMIEYDEPIPEDPASDRVGAEESRVAITI